MRTFFALLALLAVVSLATAREYVGSQACRPCHSSKHNDWLNHGHGYKFNPVNNGQPPTYPFPSYPHLPTNPPQGFAWNDITAVLGGYFWKARFLDAEGYLITTGHYNGINVQWNCINETWGTYETGAGRKPYNFACFKCHTTNPVAADSADLPNHWQQKPGIWGTWSEHKIGCEACHGPGSAHVATMNRDSIETDRTVESCRTCHNRTPDLRVRAQAPWLQHRVQFEELRNSPHSFMTCMSCHDPHKSVVFDQGGVRASATCTNCHNDREYRVALGMEGLTCIDCHMAEWNKSAVNLNPYMADEHNHFFQINTANQPRDSSFYQADNATWVRLDENGHGKIPVDVACLKCHTDQNIPWAASYADDIHTRFPMSVTPRLITTQPEAFELGQNYPNPFNPTTTIPFSIVQPGHVRLAIYNVLGQEVAVLVDEPMIRASYTVPFDASDLAGGVYVARLTVNDQMQTRKLLLMK